MPEGWYWCWITETEDRPEPEWMKIPEERRATVRAQWNAARVVRRRFKLWGPQIPFFVRNYDTVELEGPA